MSKNLAPALTQETQSSQAPEKTALFASAVGAIGSVTVAGTAAFAKVLEASTGFEIASDKILVGATVGGIAVAAGCWTNIARLTRKLNR